MLIAKGFETTYLLTFNQRSQNIIDRISLHSLDILCLKTTFDLIFYFQTNDKASLQSEIELLTLVDQIIDRNEESELKSRRFYEEWKTFFRSKNKTLTYVLTNSAVIVKTLTLMMISVCFPSLRKECEFLSQIQLNSFVSHANIRDYINSIVKHGLQLCDDWSYVFRWELGMWQNVISECLDKLLREKPNITIPY